MILKMILFLFAFILFPTYTVKAESNLNVEKHSIEEIRNRINGHGISLTEPEVMEEEASLTAPYSPGKLSEKSLNDALTVFNDVRYIVGIPPVTLSQEDCEKAQAASLLIAIHGEAVHDPSVPDDMNEELASLGIKGTTSSCLAGKGYYNLRYAIVKGWLFDSHEQNMVDLGHRRALLSTRFNAIGLGSVNGYSAFYCFDTKYDEKNYRAAWPAQYTPTDYFSKWSAWTLGLGHTDEVIDNIHVKLTRKSDNKTWNFSNEEADGNFKVSFGKYGFPEGVVIFRPQDIEGYTAGDQFHVSITGLSEGDAEYDVEFFDLKPVTKIKVVTPTINMLSKQDIALSGDINDKNHYYELEPSDCTNKTLVWTSDNPEIAKIENSYHVVGVNPGNTVIHARTLDGKVTASIQIHVHDYKYSKTSNGLAYFTCDICNDTYFSKVPTSNRIFWKYSGLTSFSSRVPKAIKLGESLGFNIQNEYSAEADKSVDDYLLEIYDKGTLLSTRTITDSTKSFKMNTLGEKTFVLYPKYNPELKQSITFEVVYPISEITISSNVEEINLGESVLFTAKKENGSNDCSYMFFMDDGKRSTPILRNYSTDNTFKWTPDKSGEFKVGVVVRDNKLMNYDATTKSWSNEEMTSSPVSVFVKESEIKLKQDSVICKNPTLTYGEPINKLTFDSPVFIDSHTENIVDGTIAWKEGEKIPDAGKYNTKWIFTPKDNKYSAVQGEITITVNKAVPKINTLPTIEDRTYHPEASLKEISIDNPSGNMSGTWNWTDDSIVPICSRKQYTATFNPDNQNYTSISKDLTINVQQASPYIMEVSASNVDCRENLDTSDLSGMAQHSKTVDRKVEGSFTWDDPDTILRSDGEYAYTFTPTDPNYSKVQGKVFVHVNKLSMPENTPNGTINVSNNVSQINNDILKDYSGWSFKSSEIGKVLDVNVPVECSIVYHGDDVDDYETTESVITIVRNQCEHRETTVINKKDANCTTDGYTGDIQCNECQMIIQQGTVIPATKHEKILIPAIPPTCEKDGCTEGQKCKVCGKVLKEQTVVPATGHKPETIPAIRPTCKDNGYTEGKKCSVCGKLLEGHELIPTLQHDFSVKTVEPTCTKKGYSEYTCKNCNYSYKDDYKDAFGHSEVIDEAVPASTTSTGLTEGSHCSVCGEVLVKQNIIPKLSNPTGGTGTPTSSGDVARKEKEIQSISNDGDVKGSKFNLLQLRSTKTTKNTNLLSWKHVSGATGYIVYGNLCGTKYRFKKLTTIKGTSWVHKNLKKGTYYKYLVVAYQIKGGTQRVIASSKTIHVATMGGKVGNYKGIKLNKKSIKLKKGKSFKIKTKQLPVKKNLKVKKHRNVCFESSNPNIATVSKSGKVKAKKKGTCVIFAYAQNGAFKKIVVVVK